MGCTGSKAKAAVLAQGAPEGDGAKTLLEAGAAPEEVAKGAKATESASEAKATDSVTEEKTLTQKLGEVLEDAKEAASEAMEKAKELVAGAGSDAVVADEAVEAKTADIAEAKAPSPEVTKTAEEKALGAEFEKESAPITLVCCFSV
jgi:hypothetical protein